MEFFTVYMGYPRACFLFSTRQSFPRKSKSTHHSLFLAFFPHRAFLVSVFQPLLVWRYVSRKELVFVAFWIGVSSFSSLSASILTSSFLACTFLFLGSVRSVHMGHTSTAASLHI